MGLQKIIDDHLREDISLCKKITKELTVVGNYLKVQYKHHAVKEHSNGIACDAHGLEQGLKVAPLYQGGNRHYSAMNLSELQELIAERKIQRGLLPKGAQNVTRFARFLDYVDWNQINGSNGAGESLSKLPKDQASLEGLLSSLEGNTKNQMIEVAETYIVNMQTKYNVASYRLVLQNRLKESFEHEQGMCASI
jgi:hypothetical protein